MHHLQIQQGSYRSEPCRPSLITSTLPSLSFYPQFLGIVFGASEKARRGGYDDAAWAEDSMRVFRLLEKNGVEIEISGLENLEGMSGPCVFIGNHMSIMETVILPAMILPYTRVTYVVKESLLTYPVFKHIMQSRNPVAVTRTNPRQDLKTVMTEGGERLGAGISIIVFPQTTRSTTFDGAHFGSIGVKLAKKAGVPVIPVALKTDAWENGKISKDFGAIVPGKRVHFAFGEPMEIVGKGNDEHQKVIDFIEKKLQGWQ